MKSLRKILLLLSVVLATSASAQLAGSGLSLTSVTTNHWNRVFISYNPSKVTTDVNGASDLDFKGFTIGYMRGIGLTSNLPLYVELGGAIQYRSYKEDIDAYSLTATEKVGLTSLNIPAHLLYRFNITDAFSIDPFFGFDFRFNLAGKYKIEADGESESINLFNDREMGDVGLDALKRFQAGWHIGVNLNYKAAYFGVHYGKDFNEIHKHLKVATTHLTLGLNF